MSSLEQAKPIGSAGERHAGRFQRSLTDAIWFILPFVGLLVIWYFAVRWTGVPTRIFPQISDVWQAFLTGVRSGRLFVDLFASIQRVGIGLGLAIVTGVPFGILMGSNKMVADFFGPLLRFSVAISGIAWIPIAIVWFGYGQNICIFIIWNTVFFAIVYNAMLGVRSIDTDIKRAARSLGARPLNICLEVLLPGAMPAIVTGLRIGLGYGWRGLMAAEMIATSAGLGYSLFMAQKSYDSAQIVLIMIIVGSLWLVMDRLFLAPLERRTIRRWGMTRAT